MNLKIATRYYKPPELLFRMIYYDYALDMGSFGCLLGELVRSRTLPVNNPLPPPPIHLNVTAVAVAAELVIICLGPAWHGSVVSVAVHG
jgi:serine/threonine protein kinase